MRFTIDRIFWASMGFLLVSCQGESETTDAYGNFEVDETSISAKAQGELLAFELEEGVELKANQIVGYIDTTQLHLQRAELEANLKSVEAQRANISAQIQVARDEVKRLKNDQARIEKMFADKAATQKQLDDINSAVQIAGKRLTVLETQYPAIAAQKEAIHAKAQLLDQHIQDAVITNPVNGIVLNKLVQEHELVMPGKPLYTIANLEVMFLKAYISANQLGEIALGDKVEVLTDGVEGKMKLGQGRISWISSKAEFTPKTIQTKNERANTVYAFKVKVENDGWYKIGMHGEIKLLKE